MDTMVKTKNMALVTGLRVNGFAITSTPQSSVRKAKR